MENITSEWLIFFFIQEIMEYKPASDELLNDIKQFKDDGANQIKIIVLTGEVKSITNNEEYLYFYDLKELYRPAGSLDSKFRDLKTGEGQYAWKDLLKYTFNEYPSNRKILITWSHGVGFGIYGSIFPGNLAITSRIEEIKNKWTFINANILKDKLKINSPQQEFIAIEKAQQQVCNKLNLVWIQDIKDALENALPENETIDVLMMVNCNMQLIDNLFILRNYVKYFIGPESAFACQGYNYKRLFSRLRKHPGIPGKILVEKIIEDYIDKYTYEMPDGKEILNDNTLFSNNLTYVDLLFELFEKIVRIFYKLIEDEQELKKLFLLRKTKMNDISEYSLGFVDLGLLLKILAQSYAENTQYHFQVYYEYYTILLDKIVCGKFIGDVYKIDDSYSDKLYGYSGIAVYFPASFTEFEKNTLIACSYYNFDSLSEFARLGEWDDFLKCYFNKVKTLSIL